MTTKLESSKRSRTVCQPKGTISYTVENHDTLEKIALRFNLTPSELIQLNKLNCRMVFPGQVLFVPETLPNPTSTIPSSVTPSANKTKPSDGFVLLNDRRSSSDMSASSLSPIPNQSEMGSMVWSIARQQSPSGTARPGRVERSSIESNPESEASTKTVEDQQKERKTSNDVHSESDEEWLRRFLKFNVQLMTEDRKQITGTLLITPNAVMFDPDLLDPWVQKEVNVTYGLIININHLVGIALFEDMALHQNQTVPRDGDKRQISDSSCLQMTHGQRFETSDEQQVREVLDQLLNQIEQEQSTGVSFRASSALPRQKSRSLVENNLTIIDHDDVFHDHPRTKSADSDPPLPTYEYALAALNDSDIHQLNRSFDRVPSQVSHAFDWSRFRRTVKVRKGFQLENCVSSDQYQHRFEEIDKLLHEHHLHYSVPHPIETPYYLCFKVLKTIDEIPSLSARTPRKGKEKGPNEHSEKRQVTIEYWFSIPKEKIDSLYNFFLRWTPERQFNALMDDNETHLVPHDAPICQGFVRLANDDPELTDDYKSSDSNERKQGQKSHYLKRQNTLLKEWEVKEQERPE